MDFNSLYFRQPKSTYTNVSLSLLPQSELIFVSRVQASESIQQGCVSLNCGMTQSSSVRQIPVLISKAEPESTKYLLYFHAMAEDIKDGYDLLQPIKIVQGVNIILVEYPGYGIYQGQKPSAEIITEDADAVFEYMLIKRRIRREDIVVVGRSMGTGPACHIAAKYNPRGLVLISPYTSLRRVAEHFVGKVLSKIVSERFKNIEVIGKVHTPILVIHGQKDEMIPQEQALKLLSAAKSRIKLFHFSKHMTHNKFDYIEDFQKQLDIFLRKIDFIDDPILNIQPIKNFPLLKQLSSPISFSKQHSKIQYKAYQSDDDRISYVQNLQSEMSQQRTTLRKTISSNTTIYQQYQ